MQKDIANISTGEKMKILFTSPILEHPAAGGPALRIENSIKALAEMSELYVVSQNAEHLMGGKNATKFYKSISHQFSFAPSVNYLFSNKYFRKIKNLYIKHFSSSDKKNADYILKLAKKNSIDIIWFGYGNISYPLITLVKSKNPKLKVICDTDSVWSRFVLRELPYESDPKRKAEIEAEGRFKEKEEASWVNFCDITTAVSEVDAEYYRGLAEDKSKVVLFSNVIDVNTYKNAPEKPDSFKNPSVYLAGTFSPKSAMDKAARWFINDILPILKKDIPDIHFYIVGSGSKETLSDISDDNISIMGKMPSVLPFLCNSDVSLVPLQFESGTRFKIMEAAACRVPIVSTTLGAEGIPVEHEKDILLADEPEDFARAITKLIQDKSFAKTISDNCYNLILKHNSISSLVEEAKHIVERLK